MSFNLTGYKIFIASPGGLSHERKGFKNTIDEYNNTEAIPRGVIFQSIGWEDTLGSMGRPQSIINDELRECDYFVMLLHDRWGSHPGENDKNATSGTEEEYKIALECCECKDYPMKQIVVFFKAVPPNQLSDPGEELKKVLAFREQLESEKTLFYKTFSSLEEFNGLIRSHLAKWLRDSDDPTKSNEGNGPVAPLDDYSYSGLGSSTSEEVITKGDIHVDPKVNDSINQAWKLANEGHLVQAEVEFSKVTVNQPGVFQLLNYAKFLLRIGRLDQALSMIEKGLEISRETNDLVNEAEALVQKGNLLKIRGDLDSAEEMYRKSLEIDEKLGNLEGMAADYRSLGNVLLSRDDLEGAEEMYKKSLEIDEKLGNLEGMAADYRNLGNVLLKRGDLDRAEEMYKRSLEIEEKLGNLEGMAADYRSLGNVLLKRGDLDRAEEMYKKSLEILKKLGNLEGMAYAYGNMGTLLLRRDDLEGAEEMYKKSLEILKKLGNLEGIASIYSNLGNALLKRGDLDRAEEMYRKSLEIDEKLGNLEGIASIYGNLGNALLKRGDLDRAEEMYKRSLEIEEKLGRLEGMANAYGSLGNVLLSRGDLDRAEEMLKKTMEIAIYSGFKLIESQVKQSLEDIKRRRNK